MFSVILILNNARYPQLIYQSLVILGDKTMPALSWMSLQSAETRVETTHKEEQAEFDASLACAPEQLQQ